MVRLRDADLQYPAVLKERGTTGAEEADSKETVKWKRLAELIRPAGEKAGEYFHTSLTMPYGTEMETVEPGVLTIIIPCYKSTDVVSSVMHIEPAGESMKEENLTVVSDGSGGWQASFTFPV